MSNNQIEIDESARRDHSFFLEYIKLIGMMLFALSMTAPILGLLIYDVDTEVLAGDAALDTQMIWDKPILPYVAGFIILVIHWFKFAEVNHSLRDTNVTHILLNFGFFFVLCLYPYFEMDIEFTSDQPHSRAMFSVAWGLLGVFSYLQVRYAHKMGFLKASLSNMRVGAIKREIIADPIVAGICVGLSYISFEVWLIGMVVLVPVVNYVMAKISVASGN